MSRRYAEIEASEKANVLQSKNIIILKQTHFTGPLINDGIKITKQYKRLNYGPFFIDCDSVKNNCVLFKDDVIAVILNIVETGENNIHLIGRKCFLQGDVYNIPCNSSNYNIHEIIENNNELFSWPISELKIKFWKIPGKTKNQ